MSPATAASILAGRAPADVTVASDYPTEFSMGVAAQVGAGSPFGPYCIHRSDDNVVVGEIGGTFVTPGVVEIGYAIVPSCWGQRFASSAVVAFVERAGQVPGVTSITAHTPLDRPASGRVLEKAGFRFAGEVLDEHEGAPLRVNRWELAL